MNIANLPVPAMDPVFLIITALLTAALLSGMAARLVDSLDRV